MPCDFVRNCSYWRTFIAAAEQLEYSILDRFIIYCSSLGYGKRKFRKKVDVGRKNCRNKFNFGVARRKFCMRNSVWPGDSCRLIESNGKPVKGKYAHPFAQRCIYFFVGNAMQ